MHEKYLAGLGGGLIIISFGIIFSSVLFEGIDKEMTVQNETLGFAQLQEIGDIIKEKLVDSAAVDEFRELLGNLIDQMKEKITIDIHKTFSNV